MICSARGIAGSGWKKWLSASASCGRVARYARAACVNAVMSRACWLPMDVFLLLNSLRMSRAFLPCDFILKKISVSISPMRKVISLGTVAMSTRGRVGDCRVNPVSVRVWLMRSW